MLTKPAGVFSLQNHDSVLNDKITRKQMKKARVTKRGISTIKSASWPENIDKTYLVGLKI